MSRSLRLVSVSTDGDNTPDEKPPNSAVGNVAEALTVIVTSLPFLVIIAGLAVSFWKELVDDRRAAETTEVAQRSGK